MTMLPDINATLVRSFEKNPFAMALFVFLFFSGDGVFNCWFDADWDPPASIGWSFYCWAVSNESVEC